MDCKPSLQSTLHKLKSRNWEYQKRCSGLATMVDYLHTILVILQLHMPIVPMRNHLRKYTGSPHGDGIRIGYLTPPLPIEGDKIRSGYIGYMTPAFSAGPLGGGGGLQPVLMQHHPNYLSKLGGGGVA